VAYQNIPDTEIGPEKPVLHTTGRKLRDNAEEAYEMIVGSPATSPPFTPDTSGHDHDGANSKQINLFAFGTADSGNKTVSADTQESIIHGSYNNLTIDATKTWTLDKGFTIIQVAGDLALNGTIRCVDDDIGPATGNAGADGDDGNKFVTGLMDNTEGLGGSGVIATPGGGGGGAGMGGDGGDGANNIGGDGVGGVNTFRDSDTQRLPSRNYYQFCHEYVVWTRPTGGGAGGGSNTDASVGRDGGEPGGILILLVEGDVTGTGSINSSGRIAPNSGGSGNQRGGGGGGGGGATYLFCKGSISAISMSANGGAGGNAGGGGGAAGGGGGGGGDRVVVTCEDIDGGLSINVNGGAGGSGQSGGGSGSSGQAGTSTETEEIYAYRYF